MKRTKAPRGIGKTRANCNQPHVSIKTVDAIIAAVEALGAFRYLLNDSRHYEGLSLLLEPHINALQDAAEHLPGWGPEGEACQ